MKCYLIGLLSMLSVHAAMGQQAIDVHCHNILPTFKELLDRHGAALEETFPLPDWDVASHLKFMEEAGIETSVLSMPAPQLWFGDVEESRRAVRQYNETCARLKADYPGKFLFCASLPLPDVDAAIKEAVYVLDTLGADGIKLATNSRGQYVGDAALDTLMQILNERHAIVMLHPHKPSPVNDGIIATTPLAVYEYPIDWDANLKAFYYDLAGGATPEVVKALLTITTPDRLLYGSDYPYQPATVLTGNLKQLRTWITDDAELAPFAEKILHDNALKLFGR